MSQSPASICIAMAKIKIINDGLGFVALKGLNKIEHESLNKNKRAITDQFHLVLSAQATAYLMTGSLPQRLRT